jgi:hypothetical protein
MVSVGAIYTHCTLLPIEGAGHVGVLVDGATILLIGFVQPVAGTDRGAATI